MKARILPASEWARLDPAHTPVFPGIAPYDMTMIVVEDDLGQIVASTSIIRATHLEGTWVDPEHRNAGVSRSLLRLASEVARNTGMNWVFTGAADDHTRRILDRMGATKIPMDTYVLGLEGKWLAAQ
jgi:GNAT superfamily N-acetyltransferase